MSPTRKPAGDSKSSARTSPTRKPVGSGKTSPSGKSVDNDVDSVNLSAPPKQTDDDTGSVKLWPPARLVSKDVDSARIPASQNTPPDDADPAKQFTPRTLAGDNRADDNGARRNVISLYETALKLMQSGKYEKAHAAFNDMLAIAPQDLADRIRMYIAACVGQIDKGSTKFNSHEEQYDYAISLLNQGNYEDAREHFQELLLDRTDCDYAFYGLALLASMTNSSHECLEHLAEAIRLNPQNRIQARSDSDFANMVEDPRFTELLYPEA